MLIYITLIKQLIVIIILFLFLTYPSGQIFSYYFLPNKLVKFTYIISPITGLAIVVILLAIADFIKIPVGVISIPYVVLSVAVYLVFLTKKREKYRYDNKMILVIALMLMIVLLAPLLKAGYLSIYGTTTDSSAYCAIGDYLADRSSRDIVPHVKNNPFYSQIEFFLTSGVRLGPMYFVASIKKLAGVKYSMQIYQTISIFMYVLSIISVYVFCLISLKFRPNMALLSSFFYGINTLIIHGT